MTYYDIDVLYKIFDDFFQPPTLEADQTGLFVLQHIRRINNVLLVDIMLVYQCSSS